MDLVQHGLLVALSAVILLPVSSVRTVLVAYILVVQIDVSGGNFDSAVTIGLGNAWKTIVLPLALLMRSGLGGFRLVRRSTSFALWAAFGGIVFLGILWSPFPLSAFKLIGYLFSFTVSFMAILSFWIKDSKVVYSAVMTALLISIIGACISTLISGKSLADTRVTFLANPQSFVLYLVISIAIVVGLGSKQSLSVRSQVVLFSMTLMLVVLSGGRTGFAAICVILVAIASAWFLIRRTRNRIAIVAATGLVLLLAFTTISIVLRPQLNKLISETRALQVVAVVTNQASIDDVKTGVWRFGMYQQMIKRIRSGTLAQLIVGRGTSSTAEIITKKLYWYRDYNSRTVDANRIAHNEFLRVVYEWGIVGIILFCSLIILVFRSALRVKTACRDFESHILLAALIPIFLFLLFENLFAMSSTPSGVAIVILLSRLAQRSLADGRE